MLGDGFLWFKPRTIICPPGVWTVVVRTCFIHMPGTFKVHFYTQEGPVEGDFQRETGVWVWPIWGKQVGPLTTNMVFDRSLWDDYFCVKVKAKALELKAEVKML